MGSEKRFAEIRKQLESHGYQLVRISGSHHLFERPGSPLLSIPVHRGKVKPYYVRQIDKICESQEEHDDEPEERNEDAAPDAS